MRWHKICIASHNPPADILFKGRWSREASSIIVVVVFAVSVVAVVVVAVVVP